MTRFEMNLIMIVVCVSVPGCSIKSTSEPAPIVLENGYIYDAKQNAISGIIRNNTQLNASWVRITFRMTTNGTYEGTQMVDAPNLKPLERRPFHEVGPPQWRESKVDKAVALPIQSALTDP